MLGPLLTACFVVVAAWSTTAPLDLSLAPVGRDSAIAELDASQALFLQVTPEHALNASLLPEHLDVRENVSAGGTNSSDGRDDEDADLYKYAGLEPPPSTAMQIVTYTVLSLSVLLLAHELARPVRPWSVVLAAIRAHRHTELGVTQVGGAKHVLDEIADTIAQDLGPPEKVGEASGPKEVSASVEEIDEETIPADPGRWVAAAALVALFFGNDLYYYMPSNFFSGEADRVGLGVLFSGFYLGAGGLSGLSSVLLGSWLTQFMNLSDVLRISISAMAVVAIPQGLGSLVHSAGGFAALELSLRLSEGVCMAVVEATLITYLLRLFQRPSEYATANAIIASSRALIGAASPFVGGSMYNSLGMAGPYTICGAIVLCGVVTSRTLLSTGVAAEGTGATNTSLVTLLRVPVFAVTVFHAFLNISGLALIDVLYQPWLGTKDGYNWDPDKISTVTVVFIASIAVGCATVAPLACAYLGDGLAVLLGDVILMLTCFFIGDPPLAFPNIRPTPWLPYVLLCIMGIGYSLNVVGFPPLQLHILAREGNLPRSETDATLAAAMTLPNLMSMFLGPFLGGALIDASGVPSSAILNASIFGVSAASVLFFMHNYLRLPSASKELKEGDEAATATAVGAGVAAGKGQGTA